MTLHVHNIWHSYLVFFEKKNFKHWVCQILFLAACRSQIECPLFAEYHCSASTFDLYVCIQLFTHQFTHQTIKIFDSINVLIRSNYINKYILKF